MCLFRTSPALVPISAAPASGRPRPGRRSGRAASRWRRAGPRACGRAPLPGPGAAGDQPLAGELGGADLGEVLLIEQGQLQRPVLGHQLPDRRGAQRGDPPVPGVQFADRADAGAGDHAAVTDHDHLAQPELAVHDIEDLGERGGVGGAALEHPDRDRAALRVGEQPVLDLQLAFLAVPGVAECPERAAPALQPGAGQVEQRHPGRVRGRGQVPAGEPALDRVLASLQPVNCRVRLVGGGVPDAQVGAERDIAPPGQGGQLGARCHDPGDDQGQGQVALAAGRPEQRGQAERAGHRVHGGDVPVRPRPGDADRRLARRDQGLAFQRGLDRIHDPVRHLGQVRQRLVPDCPAVPPGAAQQPRLVLALAALLVSVGTLDPDHMHRGRLRHHKLIVTACIAGASTTRQNFLTTNQRRRQARVPGQARDSYSEAP